jgi:SAM-dependent methyltransferase
MSAAPRRVLPEVLDELPPDDPRARRSRRDLQRVHVAMATLSILRRAIARLQLAAPPRRILELGAGDGTLLLRFAKAVQPRWHDLELTLLDRLDIVAPQTREAYLQLGWRVSVLRADVLAWAQGVVSPHPDSPHYDLCIATLFLHHFDDAPLAVLLGAVAARADAFVACEPRRDLVAHVGSRLVGVIGGNEVTREDAVTSVAAGFTQQELTALWPSAHGPWRTSEYPARPFTHCFVAAHAR